MTAGSVVDDGTPTVVFFLPARDEATTVAHVLHRVPALLKVAARDMIAVRTVVIDDGSTDGTGHVAERAGATVIRTPGLGLGAAVRIGIEQAVAAGAVAVAFCDADREYDPADLADLVTPIIHGHADYVVGSRFLGGPRRMRIHRNVGNRLLTALVRSLTARHRDVPLTDGQSGYRALSASAAGAAEIVHDYNYAQVLTIDLLRKGFRYREVPIAYTRRQTGRSFVSLPTYLRRVLPTLWRLHRRAEVADIARFPAQVPARSADDHGAKGTLREDPTMTTETTDSVDRQPIRTVVVDDCSDVRFLLSTIMELDGRFQVVGEAHSAYDGMVLVDEVEPDLVLVDLQLGGRDGTWLIRELRNRNNDAALAVVTGSPDDHVRAAALEAGADSLHSKDSMTSTMADDLAEIVARRNSRASVV